MHFMIEASCIMSFIISKCCKTMNKTNHNIKKKKRKKKDTTIRKESSVQ